MLKATFLGLVATAAFGISQSPAQSQTWSTFNGDLMAHKYYAAA